MWVFHTFGLSKNKWSDTYSHLLKYHMWWDLGSFYNLRNKISAACQSLLSLLGRHFGTLGAWAVVALAQF